MFKNWLKKYYGIVTHPTIYGLDFYMSWIETEWSKGVQDRGLNRLTEKTCFLVGG
jgi:hypothetical protein